MLLWLFVLSLYKHTHTYKNLCAISALWQQGELHFFSFFFYCPKMSPCCFIYTHWPLLKCHDGRKALWLKMQPGILSLSTCKYLPEKMEDNYNMYTLLFVRIFSSAPDYPSFSEKKIFFFVLLLIIVYEIWEMNESISSSDSVFHFLRFLDYHVSHIHLSIFFNVSGHKKINLQNWTNDSIWNPSIPPSDMWLLSQTQIHMQVHTSNTGTHVELWLVTN